MSGIWIVHAAPKPLLDGAQRSAAVGHVESCGGADTFRCLTCRRYGRSQVNVKVSVCQVCSARVVPPHSDRTRRCVFSPNAYLERELLQSFTKLRKKPYGITLVAQTRRHRRRRRRTITTFLRRGAVATDRPRDRRHNGGRRWKAAGEITEPCGVPCVVAENVVPSMIPARSHLRISRSTRRPPIRSSRKRISHS